MKPVCDDCGTETVLAGTSQLPYYECPRCEDGESDFMKSDTQRAAEQLMRAAGQEIRESPGEPSEETRLLRAKLIFEEALETIQALGVSVHWSSDGPHQFRTDLREFDLIEAVDGCCDLNVVVAGTLSALGVPDRPVQDEVEDSNRSKLMPDGTLPRHPTVEGKFGKGPVYRAPQIKRVLDSLFEQQIGGEVEA